MLAEVKKWGNSRAIRIPKALVLETGLDFGTKVELIVDGDQLRISPVQKFHYSLEELVAGITPENKHEEWDVGPSLGNEVW